MTEAKPAPTAAERTAADVVSLMKDAIANGATAGRLTRSDAMILIDAHRRAERLERLARELTDADELLAALIAGSACLEDEAIAFVETVATAVRRRLNEALDS